MVLIINITIWQEVKFFSKGYLFDLHVTHAVSVDIVISVKYVDMVLEEENFTLKFFGLVDIFT